MRACMRSGRGVAWWVWITLRTCACACACMQHLQESTGGGSHTIGQGFAPVYQLHHDEVRPLLLPARPAGAALHLPCHAMHLPCPASMRGRVDDGLSAWPGCRSRLACAQVVMVAGCAPPEESSRYFAITPYLYSTWNNATQRCVHTARVLSPAPGLAPACPAPAWTHNPSSASTQRAP